jgi:hypothetical protein
LADDLEGLPLAIQVARRLLQTEHSYGFSVVTLLEDIRAGAKLIEAQAPADRTEVANDTTPTIAALLNKSTDLLDDETRDYFAYLGAFAPKPATFDTDAMQSVGWSMTQAHHLQAGCLRLARSGRKRPLLDARRASSPRTLVPDR